MKLLPRLLAFASLLSCTSSGNAGAALVLVINTGDLVLPADAGTVGLYLTQIDDSGRMRSLLAHEEKVVIKDGRASVQFPGSLVVESKGASARLHSRFVAFRKETREVLTMREARSAVPTDGLAQLRLSLFYTNQGNVIDELPGQPVILSKAHGLQLQQAEGTLDPYARFHSVCDGVQAPAGQTSGDDGRCVALDVEPEPREPGNVLPPIAEQATCYDLAQTFAGSDAALVPRLTATNLPASGECRIPLPRAFDPSRLNVAVRDEVGFPSGNEQLRPLAADLAFRREGDAIVLPERVCNLIRDRELLFSQRTSAWRGGEPVCAAWTAATARGSFDDAVAPPVSEPRDEGPGLHAEPPAGASLTFIAAQGDEVALTFQQAGEGPTSLQRFTRAFDSTAPAAPTLAGAGALTAPTFLPVNGSPELYVLVDGVLQHVSRDELRLDVVSDYVGGPTLRGPALAAIEGKARAFWLTEGGEAVLGTFEDVRKVHIDLATTDYITDVTSGLRLESRTAFRADRWIIPNTPVRGGGWRWSVGLTPSPSIGYAQALPGLFAIYHSTRVGPNLFGYGSVTPPDAGSTPYRAFDYEDSSIAFVPTDLPYSSVPTADGFCHTGLNLPSNTFPGRLVCQSLAELTGTEPTTSGRVILENVQSLKLATDGVSLYAAYTCGTPRVHVQRIPLTNTGNMQPIPNVCP